MPGSSSLNKLVKQTKEDRLLAETYKLVLEGNRDVELSPVLPQNVWQGECSSGCNGVWKNVFPDSLERIEQEFYNNKYYIKDSNGKQVKGKQDLVSFASGVKFPLPLYFPRTFKEFKRLLDEGKLIRFTHEDDLIIRLFSYDKKILRAETENTLNELCDWSGAEF